MSSLDVVSREGNVMSVRLKGIPLQYANAIRRICLNGVPVFAVDTVDIVENTSVLADEGVAHRIGLVPLRTDLERYVEPSKCSCGTEEGCSNCRVRFVLDSGETEQTRTVLSGEIKSEDPDIVPISTDVPLIDLAPGQKVKVEAYARLGRGSDHAKWNSANVATLTDGKGGEKTLTVETTGALDPEALVQAAVDELAGRIEGLKTAVAGAS